MEDVTEKYIVLDSTGAFVGEFNSYKSAVEFKQAIHRMDWSVRKQGRVSTKRQKHAVRFCEEMLHITFHGNIEDFHDCSRFLSEHLDYAKSVWEDALSSYYSNFDY